MHSHGTHAFFFVGHAQVISNILDERPTNAADIVESISLKIKTKQMTTSSSVSDAPAGSEAVAAAAVRSTLFEKPEDDEELDDDDQTPAVADVVGTCKLFEDAGESADHSPCVLSKQTQLPLAIFYASSLPCSQRQPRKCARA
jgi:hypothetical protein